MTTATMTNTTAEKFEFVAAPVPPLDHRPPPRAPTPPLGCRPLARVATPLPLPLKCRPCSAPAPASAPCTATSTKPKCERRECVVCLEPLDTYSYLPCGHGDFHAACVTRWLDVSPRCPLCAAHAEPGSVECGLTWQIHERRISTVVQPRYVARRKRVAAMRRALHYLCLPALCAVRGRA